MDLQRIDLKALLDAPRSVSLDSLLAIFGRWRNDKGHPAKWVDLADYAHMSRGAGVVIVGKQGIFGVTRFDPGLGLYYSGRGEYEGSSAERVLETFRRHLSLTAALVGEPEYPAALKTLAGSWELAINDRLDFPNNGETDRLLRPSIEAALDKLFGPGGYEMVQDGDHQRRYGFSIQANSTDLSQLLHTAESAAA
jgi:hypothetical protein